VRKWRSDTGMRGKVQGQGVKFKSIGQNPPGTSKRERDLKEVAESNTKSETTTTGTKLKRKSHKEMESSKTS